VEFCEEMANNGKTVIVAALDGTFQRKVRHLIQPLQWDWEGRKRASQSVGTRQYTKMVSPLDPSQ
jgi:hypothetical protein